MIDDATKCLFSVFHLFALYVLQELVARTTPEDEDLTGLERALAAMLVRYSPLRFCFLYE